MSNDQKKPKVIIFDIGGVCVVSPFQAILDYEKHNGIPKGYINYAISASKPNGAWHKAERGEVELDKSWFRAFKADIERLSTWTSFHSKKGTKDAGRVPDVDAEELYWTMMSTARAPDPYMAPALAKLVESEVHIAALSNTTIFPAGHAFNEPGPDDVRRFFEVFISSAHVGMRKPNRDIYEYAMQTVQEKWGNDITPSDIVFLDDIGENLKMGREMGWRTIKVLLGRTDEAVKELERITGLQLLDGKARL